MARILFARLPALLLAAWAVPGPAAELPFEVVTAVRQTVRTEQVFDARVEAVQQSTVSAQTAGRVLALDFDVDDYVAKDSVLLRLADTEQRAALAQAEAALKEAQARHAEADARHARLAELVSKQHVSQQDMDNAAADLRAARARLDAAEAGVRRAREQLDYTVVRAPYSGVVVERHVEVGESVSVGQRLMTGFSLERLRAVTVVPQNLIEAVRHHGQARIEVRGADTVSIPGARLTFTPYADPYTHTFRVRVDLPEGEHGVYPGSYVKVAFVTGESERLLVPSRAVAYRSEVRAVYVVREDGTLGLRQVRLGRVRGDLTEILAGLSAGERIALDPVRAAVHLKREQAGAP